MGLGTEGERLKRSCSGQLCTRLQGGFTSALRPQGPLEQLLEGWDSALSLHCATMGEEGQRGSPDPGSEETNASPAGVF